jgi:hypothetical protein
VFSQQECQLGTNCGKSWTLAIPTIHQVLNCSTTRPLLLRPLLGFRRVDRDSPALEEKSSLGTKLVRHVLECCMLHLQLAGIQRNCMQELQVDSLFGNPNRGDTTFAPAYIEMSMRMVKANVVEDGFRFQ